MAGGDQQLHFSRCGVSLAIHSPVLLTAVLLLLSLAPARASLPESIGSIRPVRVLVVEAAQEVRVRGNPTLSWRPSAGASQAAQRESILLTPTASGQLHVDNQPTESSDLTVTPVACDSLFVSSRGKDGESLELEYPGTLRINVTAAGLVVINEAPLERYVACVVANEVWPTFQTEAYRAQAVVSRTFVLYQMDRRPAALIDVTATQGSQVYRGLRRDDVGRRATEAAEYTSGIVLTYATGGRQKLFCTYFSAACGGHSQSAAFLGPESDVPPLAGGVECDHCKIAPGETYRWGPLMLPVAEVTSRLALRYPEVKKLGAITAIEAVERADSGRTVTLRLTGSGGEVLELMAERFRLAVDPMRIRSTHFRVRVDREQMIFEDGRGFGHGLGLCQWGMEGQAREGRTAGQILHYYYPGAQLTRAY